MVGPSAESSPLNTASVALCCATLFCVPLFLGAAQIGSWSSSCSDNCVDYSPPSSAFVSSPLRVPSTVSVALPPLAPSSRTSLVGSLSALVVGFPHVSVLTRSPFQAQTPLPRRTLTVTSPFRYQCGSLTSGIAYPTAATKCCRKSPPVIIIVSEYCSRRPSNFDRYGLGENFFIIICLIQQLSASTLTIRQKQSIHSNS